MSQQSSVTSDQSEDIFVALTKEALFAWWKIKGYPDFDTLKLYTNLLNKLPGEQPHPEWN